jgi:hypothetical protein
MYSSMVLGVSLLIGITIYVKRRVRGAVGARVLAVRACPSSVCALVDQSLAVLRSDYGLKKCCVTKLPSLQLFPELSQVPSGN